MNRRVRGVLGTALVWGAGWAVVGLGVSGLQVVALRAAGVVLPMQPARFVALVTLRWAAYGVVAGTLFALALWATARRAGPRGALSRRGAAARGALAGAALPLVVALTVGGAAVPLVAMLPLLLTGAAFGAGSAAGTVTIARRAMAPLAAGADAPALPPPVS